MVLAGRDPPTAPCGPSRDGGILNLGRGHPLTMALLADLGSTLAATPNGPTADHLRATIEGAVSRLSSEPKGDQLRAVLHRTYVRPASTQEAAAAEVLDLPLSTYRRHLAKALEQLTDLLRAVEIGSP